MHKLLDKDGAQHLVDKFLSDQDLQDNKLDEIEEKFDDLYGIVGIEHYGIKIDKNNSDTSARIVYTHDCENYTPARMDYTNDVFEIGSWGNAFFMKNNYPAMCNFYGVEQYKLDPDDYSLKEDGASSDVADETYNGNAMSVFDCHIWMKFYEDENYQYLEVSNYKLDDDFKDYPYVRADGSKADKLYYPIYPGYVDSNNRLRSISGVVSTGNTTTAQEVQYASNCGDNWSIGDWSHYLWLHSLMLLISKNFDSQTAFGQGNSSSGSKATNGTLNTKGQFFGYNTSSDSMKVFYQENVYANRFQRLLGLYNDQGTYKIKMVPPYTYDETFDGYTIVQSPTAPPSSDYLKDLSFDSSYGILPKTTGSPASSSAYVGDYTSSNNSQANLLLAGGNSSAGSYCGSWFLYLYFRAAFAVLSCGASPYLTEPVHFDLNTIYGSSPIHFEQDNYAQPLADYTISGNSYQDGTPSPDMPVEVVSVGDLVASGEHAGEYAIPITCGGVTQNIYLDEPLRKINDYSDEIDFKTGTVTRRIKEYSFDGKESFVPNGTLGYTLVNFCIDASHLYTWSGQNIRPLCTILVGRDPYATYVGNNGVSLRNDSPSLNKLVMNSPYLPLNDAITFKAFLAQLYADGEPVRLYYVLETPTTSSITLPTITPTPGSNTLSIGTTLQPSQVSITGHIKPSSTYGQLLDVNNQAILDKNGDQIFVYGQS